MDDAEPAWHMWFAPADRRVYAFPLWDPGTPLVLGDPAPGVVAYQICQAEAEQHDHRSAGPAAVTGVSDSGLCWTRSRRVADPDQGEVPSRCTKRVGRSVSRRPAGWAAWPREVRSTGLSIVGFNPSPVLPEAYRGRPLTAGRPNREDIP